MQHPSAIISFQLQSAIADRPIALPPDRPLMDAVALMNQIDRGQNLNNATPPSCVVVIENERVIGILTDRDIVTALDRLECIEDLLIRDAMTSPAITLAAEQFTDLAVAIDLLCQHQICQLPLVDRDDRLLGLLTRDSLQPRSHTNELWLEHVSTLERELAELQLDRDRLAERSRQLGLHNEDLLRANRLKDDFLANMSHELRTPLNAILGMAEGIGEGIFGEASTEQIEAVRTIEQSSNHLLSLIDDILDLAKIGAGTIELELAPTDICDLCYSSLSFIKPQALKKQIRLQIELPQRVPQISIDERRIRQVLINLLNNAVKFTPAGGNIGLKVSIEADNTTGSSMRFAITDTGIGINSAELPKLFQPFMQVDVALNRQYNGTGLGLALVKGIVELHSGSVGVQSELNVGSQFTFDLPIAARDLGGNLLPPALEFSQPIERSLDNPNVEFSSGRLWKILLAEDNEANINSISSFLKAKGFHPILARNGLEAINLAQSELPDLILMDIQMPKMDGLEAIRYLRAHSQLSAVPIIAVTALAMSGDREKCLSAGANEYLAKPLKLKQLAATIQHLLSTSSVLADR